MISFTVPGEPVPSRRRYAVVQGRARAYQTTQSKSALQSVREFAWAAMCGAQPLEGPLEVTIRVYRARGRPPSKVGRERAERGEVRPATRPDCDNYVKLLQDGCTGVVWLDDAQIVTLHVEKWFSATPRVVITVREWRAAGLPGVGQGSGQ